MLLTAVQIAFAMATLILPLEALSCEINATWSIAYNDVQKMSVFLDNKKIANSTNHPQKFRAGGRARPESCPSLDFISVVATEKNSSYGSVSMGSPKKEDRTGGSNDGKNLPPFNPAPFWVLTATLLVVVVVATAVVIAVCYPQFFGGGMKMRFEFFNSKFFPIFWFLLKLRHFKGRLATMLLQFKKKIAGRESATTASSSTKGDRVTSTTAFLLTLLLSQQIQLVVGHFEQLCIGTRDPTKGPADLCTDDMIYVYMVRFSSL